MKRDCAACRDETDAASHAERSVYTGDEGRKKHGGISLESASTAPRERRDGTSSPLVPGREGH